MLTTLHSLCYNHNHVLLKLNIDCVIYWEDEHVKKIKWY